MTVLDTFLAAGSSPDLFTIFDVMIVLMLSFILSLIIGKVYEHTHKGISYSQNYVQTLVILTVVVSSVMLIVGSNIARAFTLVGALSIIRFRNAIKETKDIGFIFFSMAVGMAVGTKFYLMGIAMTIFISIMSVLMALTHFGSKKVSEDLVKIQIVSGKDHEEVMSPIFDKFLKSNYIVSVDSIDEKTNELTYIVQFKKGAVKNEFANSIKKLKLAKKVTLLHQEHTIDI